MKHLRKFNEKIYLTVEDHITKNIHDILLELEDEGIYDIFINKRDKDHFIEHGYFVEIVSKKKGVYLSNWYHTDNPLVKEVIKRLERYMNSEGYNVYFSTYRWKIEILSTESNNIIKQVLK